MHPRILNPSLILTALLAATSPQISAQQSTGTARPPLLNEAYNEYKTMSTTHYQRELEVDYKKGVYRFDCVGFVSSAMRVSAPKAWSSVSSATGVSGEHSPDPAKYRAFLSSLSTRPQNGWQAVTKVADLRAGDIVVWEHTGKSGAIGHAVILAEAPKRRGDAWEVEVYDSTSSHHGDDSRQDDKRAEILTSTGKRSGLGHGKMALTADNSGVLNGLRWSPRAETTPAPIAAGRPLN